jgi:hypothetical protein
MKYIKKYKLFESLESKIDLLELDSILIDFKQMGLEYDVKFGSSVVIDWHLFNRFMKGLENEYKRPFISSSGVDKFHSIKTNNSLTVELTNSDNPTRELSEYNIEETKEAYEMLKSYLYDNYDLIPNYIYINFHWDYLYFENFDRIKEHKNIYPEGHSGIIFGSDDKNKFKAHRLIFGFYEDPNAVFRGPEF